MEQGPASTLTNSTRDASVRRYTTMGIGTAVLAGAITTMDAAVVYTNYNSQIYRDTNTTDTVRSTYDFDFNSDGTNDLRLNVRNEGSTSPLSYAAISAGTTGNVVTPLNVVGTLAPGAGADYGYASRLGTGTLVGAARAFINLTATGPTQFGSLAYGDGSPGSMWTTAGANLGFLGFSFTLADGLHYGFIGLTVAPQGQGDLSRAVSIGGIGYETTANTGITTFGSTGSFAAVPEPSSLALLAAGGLGGVAAYRRRRQQASAQAQTVG